LIIAPLQKIPPMGLATLRILAREQGDVRCAGE
jgi:hypothetical protein